MNKYIALMVCCIITLFGCEQEVNPEIAPELSLEIQTESSIGSIADCYNEMRIKVGDQFQGTSCQVCGSYSANPGDTITLYGVAFFYDGQITSLEDTNYDATWSMIEGDGTLLQTEDPRVVQLVIPEVFNELIIRLHNETGNGLVVAENFSVRNALQAIEITDPGQAGIVMYDKGQYVDNWRFMEVTSGVIGRGSVDNRYETQWGCLTQEIGVSATNIGAGKSNSARIIAFMNDIPDYESDPNAWCSSLNDGTVTAWVTDVYPNNGFTDWHLPSLEEAQMVAQNLGWLSEDPEEKETLLIWTSSEISAELAYAVDLYSGEAVALSKHLNLRAMGVRYF